MKQKFFHNSKKRKWKRNKKNNTITKMKLYKDGRMFPKTECSLKGRIFSISLCHLSRIWVPYDYCQGFKYKIPFVTVKTFKVFNFLNSDLHIHNEKKRNSKNFKENQKTTN